MGIEIFGGRASDVCEWVGMGVAGALELICRVQGCGTHSELPIVTLIAALIVAFTHGGTHDGTHYGTYGGTHPR